MKKLLIVTVLMLGTLFTQAQKTYCNPVNVDYGYTPHASFTEWGKHRATADPVIVNYKGEYYLFSTNQWGYWWSKDMSNWNFVAKRFLQPWNDTKDELCAPAVGIIGDTMVVFGSTYTSTFTLWGSTDPKGNKWFPLVDSFEIGGWDPAFFTDDDGRFYMYNGSSNNYPVYG
ncbi:MAG: family 43 glycosylhydrolase, partial [Chitinophagaceae bacterium]